jgi:hypothetical protein
MTCFALRAQVSLCSFARKGLKDESLHYVA